MVKIGVGSILSFFNGLQEPKILPTLFLLVGCLLPAEATAQATVKARVPATIKPAWTKGIQAANRENYWNAVECGKQGGARPACVFYDADACKNDDFALSLYTPYKMVAYTVWSEVSKGRKAPTPSWAEAQRTRIILGVSPLERDNPVTGLVVRRGGKTLKPAEAMLSNGGGTFYYDFAAFAPTTGITIEFIGKSRTVNCVIDRAVLARFR